MTRKRYNKLCMGLFKFDRNAAEAFANMHVAEATNWERVMMAAAIAGTIFPISNEMATGFTGKTGASWRNSQITR